MGQPARLLFPVTEITRPQLLALPSWSDVGLRFQSLILTEPLSLARVRGLGLVIALLVDGILVAAAILVPLLLFEDNLPASDHEFILTVTVAFNLVGPTAGRQQESNASSHGRRIAGDDRSGVGRPR